MSTTLEWGTRGISQAAVKLPQQALFDPFETKLLGDSQFRPLANRSELLHISNHNQLMLVVAFRPTLLYFQPVPGGTVIAVLTAHQPLPCAQAQRPARTHVAAS